MADCKRLEKEWDHSHDHQQLCITLSNVIQ